MRLLMLNKIVGHQKTMDRVTLIAIGIDRYALEQEAIDTAASHGYPRPRFRPTDRDGWSMSTITTNGFVECLWRISPAPWRGPDYPLLSGDLYAVCQEGTKLKKYLMQTFGIVRKLTEEKTQFLRQK